MFLVSTCCSPCGGIVECVNGKLHDAKAAHGRMLWVEPANEPEGPIKRMPYIQIAAARFLLVAACVAALVGLALRSADSTAAPDGTEVRLLFVGDLMPGRYVRTSMRIHGYDAPFDQVRSFFSSADLALGNLEGPLVSGRIPIPTPFPNQLVLSGEDKVAPALARAGLDILSLANNHSWDAGADGLQSTMNAL